jgi:photosystem II stability/assembly factor-like uncharacterized protein
MSTDTPGQPPSPEEVLDPNYAQRESGPRGWYRPMLVSAYARLTERRPEGGLESISGASVEEPEAHAVIVPRNFWVDRLAEYKRRKTTGQLESMRGPQPEGPPAPSVPGAKNWTPLGPTVLLEGQARGRPPMGGRIAGIAVAQGGQTVYAATANGGVFRSDNGGESWRSLMDAFDVDPTNYASTSLASGAIALAPGNPSRIYVGTGEGNTHTLFGNRVTNALPAYRGIGPIRTDTGDFPWLSEPTAASSPRLAGEAFFELAVDPGNIDDVMAATTAGLYQRVMRADGSAEWIRRLEGVFSSVVAVAKSGVTHFMAAKWGEGVSIWTAGQEWTPLGSEFPSDDVGRIGLAVQTGNPDIVYAFVATASGARRGLFRLDGRAGPWAELSHPPDVIPGGQGGYNMAICVDPADPDLIYVGGDWFNDPQFWPASIWRCRISQRDDGVRAIESTPIGVEVHADVHVLVHSPGNPDELWVGCDGGVFLNRDPRGTGKFEARNNGLACLCANFFDQHPTDPGIIFCGLQDNGTARTGGEPAWRHVNGGDGGYCLINAADPEKVLVFANGSLYRSTTGGRDHNSWTRKKFDWALMTMPFVSPPHRPGQPSDASIVALAGSKNGNPTVFVSPDFGASWPVEVTLPAGGGIFAMTFATAGRIFAATTFGQVFRLDKGPSQWSVAKLHDVAAGSLPLTGLIADIAVDWADPQRNSIYIAHAGIGDYRHVWHFNGARWEPRSGPAAGQDGALIDVEHNAIVVDPLAPQNVYVGADIGVWHSADGGRRWAPLANGLPDAPIFDLRIHPTHRLLRAATHGRGMYQWELDPPVTS